jgi:hypothetical protein
MTRLTNLRRQTFGIAPRGRRTVSTEPLPGLLAMVTSPPIMRASLRQRTRPSSSRHSGARSGNLPSDRSGLMSATTRTMAI